MSEEIKEFAPVSEEGPKFDPNKKYTWHSDATIAISGSEFGTILNALRNVVGTQEARALFAAADAAERLERVLVRHVENGVIVEAPEAPKESL
jgi:hypothetical protein